MTKHESYGTCSFCQEKVAKSKVSQHLRSCGDRKRAEEELRGKRSARSEVDVYHLGVEPVSDEMKVVPKGTPDWELHLY